MTELEISANETPGQTGTVLIIGGGIGGVAAALALDRIGVRVRLFERVPRLEEVGAGLGVWTNAIRALDRLGVAGEVRRSGMPLTTTEVCSSTGRVLKRMRMGEYLSEEGAAATYVVHRADLHGALLRRLPPGILRAGCRFEELRQDGARVVATFDGCDPAEGALLIGADGIHSRVRSLLRGEEAIRYSGQTCYRGIARLRVPDPSVLREVQGPGQRGAVCALAPDRVYWWAAINARAGESDEPALRRQLLLERFAGWPYLIPEAIAASEGPILRNDLVDRAPLRRWSSGRVTLLGDAAHPMLPNLGQGACTAIEDAVVLARAIAAHGTTEAALRAYERERLPRTSGIVRESWYFGIPVRWRSRPAVRLREALVRLTPTPVLARALRRHLDYDPGRLPDRVRA